MQHASSTLALCSLQVLYTDDLCAGEQVFFAATGVSDGDLLKGVRYFAGGASSNSIVMRSGSGTGTLLSNGPDEATSNGPFRMVLALLT